MEMFSEFVIHKKFYSAGTLLVLQSYSLHLLLLLLVLVLYGTIFWRWTAQQMICHLNQFSSTAWLGNEIGVRLPPFSLICFVYMASVCVVFGFIIIHISLSKCCYTCIIILTAWLGILGSRSHFLDCVLCQVTRQHYSFTGQCSLFILCCKVYDFSVCQSDTETNSPSLLPEYKFVMILFLSTRLCFATFATVFFCFISEWRLTGSIPPSPMLTWQMCFSVLFQSED